MSRPKRIDWSAVPDLGKAPDIPAANPAAPARVRTEAEWFSLFRERSTMGVVYLSHHEARRVAVEVSGFVPERTPMVVPGQFTIVGSVDGFELRTRHRGAR